MIKQILANETYQLIHRTINTVLMLVVAVIGLQLVTPLYDKISGIESQRIVNSELAQLVMDEGYRSTPYLDSLGKLTIGFGHLVKPDEDFTKITPHNAVQMLRKDYANATEDVERRYDWVDGDAKLVLVNLTYNLGSNGLSKFTKTIHYLKTEQYDLAAGELLTSVYAKQVPSRASRLASRIMQLE